MTPTGGRQQEAFQQTGGGTYELIIGKAAALANIANIGQTQLRKEWNAILPAPKTDIVDLQALSDMCSPYIYNKRPVAS